MKWGLPTAAAAGLAALLNFAPDFVLSPERETIENKIDISEKFVDYGPQLDFLEVDGDVIAAPHRKPDFIPVENFSKETERISVGTDFEIAWWHKIQNLREDEILDRHNIVIAVYDHLKEEFVACINCDYKIPAASMIKPFFALAFFDRAENEKRGWYGQTSRIKLNEMLVSSNNYSTNWVANNIGQPQQIEERLNREFGITGIEIHQLIPTRGRNHGAEYLNKVSAREYVAFMSNLLEGSYPYNEEIVEYMERPNSDRLLDGTPLDPRIKIRDKTGTTGILCGNFGTMFFKQGDIEIPMTIVVAIEKNYRNKSTGWCNNGFGGQIIRSTSLSTHDDYVEPTYNINNRNKRYACSRKNKASIC